MRLVLFTILSIFFVNISFSQDIPTINLKWKLEDNETLTYRTIMEEIKDSTSLEEKDEFKIKLEEANKNTVTRTILKNSENFENVIDIEMISVIDDESKSNDREDKLLSHLVTGTLLRGSIRDDGSLHSFWIKNDQKSIVSVFFELPTTTVSKGDTWTLNNVNFVNFGHAFVCKDADNRNNVTLTEIYLKDDDTIAVIDYNIYQFASGDFKTSSISLNNNSRAFMKQSYIARGEFSLKKGRWISYNGVWSSKSESMLGNLESKLKIELIEE